MDLCDECDRPYGDRHGFPDMIVPDWAWKIITPKPGTDGGLLCPSCICQRLTLAGVTNVPFAFTSGPLSLGDGTLVRAAP